jgi:outer membrane protein TolC
MSAGFLGRVIRAVPGPWRLGVAGMSLLTLNACASFSPDGGMAPVATHVSAEIGKDTVKITSEADATIVRERVSALLAQPLTADGAVQIALINNRGLQAKYNGLGISEAAYVEASLPPNPTFSLLRLSGGGTLEIERSLAVDVLALFTLPARSKIAEREFRVAQYKTIDATFRMAAATRRAYYNAIAAQQLATFLERAQVSADAAADLMRRLGETGASSKLDQARIGSFYAEISTRLGRARLAAKAKREALTRMLGLWGADTGYKLPEDLPEVPADLEGVEQVEADAIRRRVDLIAARLELETTASALGLTEATRFVSLLEAAGVSKSERDNGELTRTKGFELSIQIPIFDFGEVGVRRARETYMQSVNLLIEKAINVRSEVRAAYQTYHASYDIWRQYQNQILPLRRVINEQALLQYNGMLIDAFELLTTARESIANNMAAIEARRDFFLAQIDFQSALIGGGTGVEGEGIGAMSAAAAGDD